MAGRTDAPAKCELRNGIHFLRVEGWFVEDDQCSCFLSNFTTSAKSHSVFWSCPHSWQRRPHNAIVTQHLLGQLKWDVSDHRRLTTSDFHLFPELKKLAKRPKLPEKWVLTLL
ncbi:hypothetical protein AVEN_22424-1 [Araneus ventricosus]|uniref:Uncharacterized protein n=1 Tax=Araneus ventricosus TaxID=182803 RepID=A0A4Y2V5S2_ARAVE|nr:hypothetical protein AVEN_76801-1 [Araneus ventricosus]GBO19030.1 hypothetical protein AVEN_22424-1 [Araneus ventricosus]